MRASRKNREATSWRADGVVLVKFKRKNFLDQHHPGASRHPSSAEEGSFTDINWLSFSYVRREMT